MAVSIRRAHVTPGPYRQVCPDARPVLARLAYGRKAVWLIQPDRLVAPGRAPPTASASIAAHASGLGPSLMPGVERLALSISPHCPMPASGSHLRRVERFLLARIRFYALLVDKIRTWYPNLRLKRL